MIYPSLSEKAPSVDWIRSQYALLTTIFSERNSEYSVLRKVFDADTATASEARAKAGTIFQDRIKLIYNIGNATVRRYMDSMSAPPRMECIPEGFELEDLELADKRTKVLEYIYSCNNMGVKLIQSAYYQSLLDKAIWHVRPAPHLPHKIRIELGVPDFYYPVTRGDDWQHPVAVIYGFRSFRGAGWVRDPNRFDGQQEYDTNIEYWDSNWFVRIEPEKVIVINHGLGVIPWFETHNLPIPHRFRGQGDIDQVVGMNEYLNMLMSAMGDMIAYAAAPIAIVRGTKVGGTNLPFEPRAVWELERDAQVGFLQWSGAPPSVESQILRSIQAIEDMTGVSSPAFGREIPSGVSGNAVRSLLAGFNTRLGTKQQLLGDSLVKVNECVQLMLEKMFPDTEFRVNGENIVPGRELGKKKAYTVKPKEFAGWYRNRVVFSPLDPAATYFQEVDKWQKGLQSRYTTMKALGVQNVWDELERIRLEKMEEAEHENRLAMAKQGQFVSPMQQEEQQAADQQALEGLIEQLKGGNTPGAAPDAIEDRRAKRQLEADVQKQNTAGGVQSPVDTSVPPVEPAKPFDINPILSKLKTATNLTGKAALKGEEIELENPADEQAIRAALGSDASRFKFIRMDPNKTPSADTIEFFSPQKGQKKNQVEIRAIKDGYLNVVVLGKETTNNQAVVYTIGIKNAQGQIAPIGKTDPTRGGSVDQGELIRVSVGSISRREDSSGVRYGLGATKPVKAQSPASPSSLKEVEKLFSRGMKRDS